eukprot:365052-Chlamydomonas_euryale.AAC.20
MGGGTISPQSSVLVTGTELCAPKDKMCLSPRGQTMHSGGRERLPSLNASVPMHDVIADSVAHAAGVFVIKVMYACDGIPPPQQNDIASRASESMRCVHTDRPNLVVDLFSAATLLQIWGTCPTCVKLVQSIYDQTKNVRHDAAHRPHRGLLRCAW